MSDSVTIILGLGVFFISAWAIGLSIVLIKEGIKYRREQKRVEQDNRTMQKGE